LLIARTPAAGELKTDVRAGGSAMEPKTDPGNPILPQPFGGGPAKSPPAPPGDPCDAARRVGELVLSMTPEQLVIMLPFSGLQPEQWDEILDLAVARREAA
jgi:hypothetical protein